MAHPMLIITNLRQDYFSLPEQRNFLLDYSTCEQFNNSTCDQTMPVRDKRHSRKVDIPLKTACPQTKRKML